MFMNGVEIISSELKNITLDTYNKQGNMHPKTEKTPPCQKGQVPRLHLTPSAPGLKRDGVSTQAVSDPFLLKPQHEIPPTPPPQTDSKCENYFLQRIG